MCPPHPSRAAGVLLSYLGCPATSATVERLFSKVGIAFSAKCKSSEAATLEDLMFAKVNLP